MPSGKTHDMVTLVLAPPTFAAAWGLTGSVWLSATATVAMIFGGLMFGPDLDIQSRQYTRWGPLRFLWWPYKVILPHRSRLSHSILIGTQIRVIYFLAVITLLVVVGLYVREVYIYNKPAGLEEVQGLFAHVWKVFSEINRSYLIAAFIGLWIGATSHTVSDVLGSFFKSVRRSI